MKIVTANKNFFLLLQYRKLCGIINVKFDIWRIL